MSDNVVVVFVKSETRQSNSRFVLFGVLITLLLAIATELGAELYQPQSPAVTEIQQPSGAEVIPLEGNRGFSLTEQERDVLKAYPVLRLAVEPNWAPIDFIDHQGMYKGLSADYVALVAERLDIRFEPIWKPSWADKETMLKNKTLDAAGSIVETEQRSKYLSFSIPYFESHKAIFAKKNTRLESIGELSGRIVAVEAGYSIEQELNKYYPDIDLMPVTDTRAALEAVSFGKADAYIGNRATTQFQIDKYQLTDLTAKGLTGLPNLDFRIAVRKDWQNLIPIFNKVLTSISQQERDRIQHRWIGQNLKTSLQIRLTRSEQTWLKQHPILRFSGDPNWPPVEYADSSGHHQGMVSDYLNLIAQALDVRFQYIAHDNWNQALLSAQQREVDLLPEAAATPKRMPYLNFTRPYIKLPFVIFTLEEMRYVNQISDLAGKRTAVVEGYVTKETIAKNYPDVVLQPYLTATDCLLALSEGKVDAYVGSLAVSSYLIQDLGLSNIKVAAITKYGFDLAIGVRKDWPELIPILQKALDAIDPKQRLAIRKNWLAVQYENDLDYDLLWKIAVAVTIVLLLGIAWNAQIQRQRRILGISEERFRLAMDASSEGIWDWNIETGAVYYSPGYMRMLGFKPDEMAAKHATWKNLLHPEDRDAAIAFVKQAVTEKRSGYAHEFRVRTKRGGYRHIYSIGSVVSESADGKPLRAVGTQKDITEQKAYEDRLMIFQRFAETSGQGFGIATLDAKIEYRNRRLTDLLEESSTEEAYQKDLSQYYPADIAKRLKDKIIPVVIAEGQWTGELEIITTSGRRIPTIENFFLIKDKSGAPVYIGDVITDISDQKLIQRDLKRAMQVADQASRSKSEFLANMSHEIRTPLNAIVGMSYLAAQTELNPRQSDYIKKIQSSAQILLSVINDILDFSKIEAGQLKIENVAFRLDEVLENLVDLAVIKAEEKHLELIVSRATAVPNELTGDPLRLGQVLSNLVSNAVKFTDEGEIIVRVDVEKIENRQVWLVFTVTDTGVGIETEKLPGLFEPFIQADGSTTRKFGGTGLGLTICRQLVNKMGGAIGAQSQVGSGSEFKFCLPFDSDHADLQDLPQDLDLRNLKVLIVDDNAKSREVLAEILRSFTFQVSAVNSGSEALEILSGAEPPFQVMFLDWSMPIMDGAETARMISDDSRIGKLSTIAMVNPTSKEYALQLEGDEVFKAVLIKPASTSQLLDTVVKAVGRNAHQLRVPKLSDKNTGRSKLRGTVLLVEDNPINQEVAKGLLDRLGLNVVTAANGLEALASVRANAFDLLLMDIQMPEMDGIEATKQIRQDQRFDNLPIIAMTAHAMQRDREKSRAAGMNDHVVKPIDPDELYNSLARYLSPSVDVVNPEQSASALFDGKLALAGVDMEKGLARTGGSQQLYVRLLLEFCQDHGGDVAAIRSSLAEHDFVRAQQIAHTLCGVAGSLGASGVYSAAESLERALRNSEAGVEFYLESMESKLLSIVAAVTTLELREPGQRENRAGAAELLNPEQLTVTRNLLVEGDVRAIQLIGSFPHSEARKKLLEHAENYDFDEALAVLNDMVVETHVGTQSEWLNLRDIKNDG